MAQCIIVGCDLHTKSLLLKYAADREAPAQASFANTRRERARMLGLLRTQAARHRAARVVFVYEASSLGFGLYDEVTAAGFACFVLAPHRIARSWKQRAHKTDERDAQLLFELARAHVLAGNDLPAVWVPDGQTRDDREITRARIDASQKLAGVKTQVQSLVKRHGIERPVRTGKSWTKAFRAWLDSLVGSRHLGTGASVALTTLLAQMRSYEQEVEYLDEHLARLAAEPRHAPAVAAMTRYRGVGLQVALTFLVELGDMRRFANRRQVASYLGLVPRSHESGEANDRKGHITHQGPPRVRKLLCQAVHTWVRWDPRAAAEYGRLVARRKKPCKKIATVAMMRRLGIRLWHRALDGQRLAAEAHASRKETCAS
ncbi:IS110 family transposase [bacterium]|nr:IS110 family transposase [bacterium]